MDATQLLAAESDERRLTAALYRVRRGAARVAGECERLLDELPDDERASWREALGTALLAARHLMAVARPPLSAAGPDAAERLASLAERVSESRARIASAMEQLLAPVPDPLTVSDALVQRDARSVLDAALQLLGDERPGGEQERAGTAVDPGTEAPDVRRPARVLIADDNDAVRRVLARHIERLGWTVTTATNGRDALDRARSEPFDLLLSDIDMPEMDGMTLLASLKDHAATRDLPVIMISGQGDLASVVACIERGADDHIAKPYEPALLQARVRASVDRKRMRDVEVDYRARVAQLTRAAEAVERERYASGSLDAVMRQQDELGRLARVFDRMVAGLQSREQRLQRRVAELRREMGEATERTRAAATVSDESPFASGEILAARYEVLGQLGTGGMGMVYHARDLELGEDVAVKVVRRDIIKGDPAIVDRLKSESRLARRLSHRNVVRVHDLGEWKGTYFITMEYVRGITVEQLIDRRGRLSVESTLAIGMQLADALSVAHDAGIIHRDIKPANLFVDHDGVLKVMDFGIAQMVHRDDKLTLGGFIVGTPQYMSPEQMMGHAVDARSDLFAAGVVLYECLSGRPPFMADSPIALIARASDGEFVRLRELVPGVPAGLDALVERLLAFQPADRPATARELLTRLSEMEHEGAGLAPPVLEEIDLEIIDIADAAPRGERPAEAPIPSPG